MARRGEGARRGLSSSLIVAQVALSLVLLVAAGLFVRTFASLAIRDAGFERDRVLLVTLNSQRAIEEPSQRLPLFERVREAVTSLPGIADAALSEVTPVQGGGIGREYRRVRRRDSERDTLIGGIANGFGNSVSPGWFRTFGVPLLAGSGLYRGRPVGNAACRDCQSGARPVVSRRREPARTYDHAEPHTRGTERNRRRRRRYRLYLGS